MAILITGGTGSIGSALARRLIERGEKDLILFDVAPRLNRISDIKDKVKIVSGDLTVWPEVMNAVKSNNVQGIFHLGSMLSGACEANPWSGYQTIVTGTMHVLEAARLFGVKRVFFSSTQGTYGIGIPEVITEETLQRPITLYGSGKLFGEHLGRFYRRKFGIDFRCLRYFMVVAPGSRVPEYTQHNISMIENPALGKPYVCRLNEEAALPLTYIKDIVRGTEMLYYAPEAQIKTICYNIVGVSPARTAGELQQAVKKFLPDADITFKPEPELVRFFEAYFGGTKSVDDSRAREEWGWEPLHTDFEKIVEDFIREVRASPRLWGLS